MPRSSCPFPTSLPLHCRGACLGEVAIGMLLHLGFQPCLDFCKGASCGCVATSLVLGKLTRKVVVLGGTYKGGFGTSLH